MKFVRVTRAAGSSRFTSGMRKMDRKSAEREFLKVWKRRGRSEQRSGIRTTVISDRFVFVRHLVIPRVSTAAYQASLTCGK